MAVNFMIDGGLLVGQDEVQWINSNTGMPIEDGPRGHCYWRLTVIPEEHVIATAKAICLAEFGDEKEFGEMRCCQVGGINGCCLRDYMAVARAAITAYETAKGKDDADHQNRSRD